MFKKILIANRGEIALRIIRACKELGIKTVIAYSKADQDSLPVRLSDEAVCVGPAEAARSYLNIPSIISAAEITDAEAIHPGYGFLAENWKFAEICQSCNIKFIGPTPEQMRLMGNKSQAREIAKKLAIPVLEGSEGVIKDSKEALDVASQIGYPVMIKAAAGGGGKGMRIAHTEISLVNSFYVAQNEAAAAFGDPGLYIEKYIERPRHVEIQILGDGQAKNLYFPERDCSIQRRHQKLIEESPSPAVDSALREEMGKMATRLAQHCCYLGVGTVEFIMDQKKHFYFLEMNTRLQVEHGVTEMVTGIDLVREQLNIAAGRKLHLNQSDIRLGGHSIECRVNAEDPEKFVPSAGEITSLHIPGGFGIRVDSAIHQGYQVKPYYDSLLAKLIVFGKNRREALQKMEWGLLEFQIEGIKTTIPFLHKVMTDRNFREGETILSFT